LQIILFQCEKIVEFSKLDDDQQFSIRQRIIKGKSDLSGLKNFDLCRPHYLKYWLSYKPQKICSDPFLLHPDKQLKGIHRLSIDKCRHRDLIPGDFFCKSCCDAASNLMKSDTDESQPQSQGSDYNPSPQVSQSVETAIDVLGISPLNYKYPISKRASYVNRKSEDI
jgi:hypothetical protein